jgi:hypothetical protein
MAAARREYDRRDGNRDEVEVIRLKRFGPDHYVHSRFLSLASGYCLIPSASEIGTEPVPPLAANLALSKRLDIDAC